MVTVPQNKNTYCKFQCKKHTPHKVRQYYKYCESTQSHGLRKDVEKHKGFGGHKKPIQRMRAKETRRVVLRLVCTICKGENLCALPRTKTFMINNTNFITY
jgi:large subunit ribosomal protein L44e